MRQGRLAAVLIPLFALPASGCSASWPWSRRTDGCRMPESRPGLLSREAPMSIPATPLARVRRGRLLPCDAQTGILVVAAVLLTVMLRWDARGAAQPPSSPPQEEKPPDFTSKSLSQWIEALKDLDDAELRDRA